MADASEREFVIAGIHPATGRVVEVTLRAETEVDALVQAERAGLQKVVIVAAGPTPTQSPPEPAADAARSDTPTILLVEDFEETRRVLERLLTGDGYRVVAVAGGEEALAYLEIGRASLVITDFHMPGMNGLTLSNHLRNDARLRAIPIILFSVETGDLKEVALRAGIDAFIEKTSMDWATLRSAIIRLAGPGILAKKLPEIRGGGGAGAGGAWAMDAI